MRIAHCNCINSHFSFQLENRWKKIKYSVLHNFMSHSLCRIRRNATMDYFRNSPSNIYTYTVNQCEPRLTFRRTVNRIWFNRNFHFTFRPHRHELSVHFSFFSTNLPNWYPIKTKSGAPNTYIYIRMKLYYTCYANSNCDLIEFNFNFSHLPSWRDAVLSNLRTRTSEVGEFVSLANMATLLSNIWTAVEHCTSTFHCEESIWPNPIASSNLFYWKF